MFTLKNSDLCELFLIYDQDINVVSEIIRKKYGLSGVKIIKDTLLKVFCGKFNQKWIKANRTKSRFITQNRVWLNNFTKITEKKSVSLKVACNGRPPKKFADCSERTKRRKAARMVQMHDFDEIKQATISGNI